LAADAAPLRSAAFQAVRHDDAVRAHLGLAVPPSSTPPLTSEQYAQDFNEVKLLGSMTSSVRTPEQTQTAVFCQADTPAAI
jgi:hypothetical protein